MERGAFSDKKVVAAAKKGVISILVDCNWGRANKDVSGKYKVRGYPTILFINSKGKVIESGSRNAKRLTAQFEKHAKTDKEKEKEK